MNIQQAASLILETNLDTLSRIHRCTVEQVCKGIADGNAKLITQFRELAELGVKTVMEAV